MWIKIARLILRNRIALLTAVVIVSSFLAYKATFVEMNYGYSPLLPENDSISIKYKAFKKQFGNDRNTMLFAVQDSNFFEINRFRDWMDLGDTIEKIDGVESVFSIPHTVELYKETDIKKFNYRRIFAKKPDTQAELDSMTRIFKSFPFYHNMLSNDSAKVYVMAIVVAQSKLASKERESIVEKIENLSKSFAEKHAVPIYHSGLPYLQTRTAQKVRKELLMFVILAALVTTIIMFLFFKSFRVVLFSMLIVLIGVLWAFGTMALFGYKISILTGIIPPLLIVIGIPNSVFLLNKYHSEYRKHGNKMKALQRMIHKVGNATFLTNLTTASGFATFILTDSIILKEFGMVASLNIMGVFILTLLLIPIVFSFLPPPERKHTKHLDRKFITSVVKRFIHYVKFQRKWIYRITLSIVFLGFIGLNFIKQTGYILNDIPYNDPIHINLQFFEKYFNGVMPIEFSIDTKKPKGVIKISTLKRIEKLGASLKKYPEISRPFSIADVAKFARQSYFNNAPENYKLPSNQEKNFILKYIPKDLKTGGFMHRYIDSTFQITRLSAQVGDVGTVRMKELHELIQADIDSIFPAEKFNVDLTGFSILYYKGANYLTHSLFVSLTLAIILIAFFMAWMFRSWRMVLVSLIPNLIPLLVTAAIMGYFGIPIKPSTVLVFSIAFGISVDDTIHFLAKFRQELLGSEWNIKQSVLVALEETGVSMIYTSIVLFFGFGIFIASSFGGTVALGLLVSITLLVAMFANLLLLPSLLLSLDRSVTNEAFKEPLLSIFDEEVDIDLDKLRIENKD